MTFLLSQSERDMIVGHNQVLGEAEGAAFSSVEEDVGDGGRDGGLQELESRFPWVPVDQGEHMFGAV